MAVKYILSVLLAANIIIPVYNFLISIVKYIEDISIFIGVLAPTISILAASGGNVAAAKAGGLSFSIFLSCVQILLERVIPTVISVILGISVIDSLTGEGKFQSVSAFVKNCIFGIFSFLSAIFLIIVSFSGSIAANTDTVSFRAMKLLISNAIPIIGGTIGEAVKFAGGSLVAIKNSIGMTALIFIICIFVPVLIMLWICGLVFNVFMFLCDYFETKEIKWLISHLKCAVDFCLASISVIVVAALINIGIFINQLPAVLA